MDQPAVADVRHRQRPWFALQPGMWRPPSESGRASIVIWVLLFLMGQGLGLFLIPSTDDVSVGLIAILALLVALSAEYDHLTRRAWFRWLRTDVVVLVSGLAAAPLVANPWTGYVTGALVGVFSLLVFYSRPQDHALQSRHRTPTPPAPVSLSLERNTGW